MMSINGIASVTCLRQKIGYIEGVIENLQEVPGDAWTLADGKFDLP